MGDAGPYEVLVCPVCREQVPEASDYGWGCYHAEYGGEVEPMTVKVELPNVEGMADLALFRLTEDQRDRDWREASRVVWDRLPQEEKDRRIAALPPEVQALRKLTEMRVQNLEDQLGYLRYMKGEGDDGREKRFVWADSIVPTTRDSDTSSEQEKP